MNENAIKTKSFEFAILVIEISRKLTKESKEYILSNQFLRSGTAIGALYREAEQAESKKDFVHKLAIALKEANETEYWIELMFQTKLIFEDDYRILFNENKGLIKLLTAIINSTKKKYL